MGELSGTTVIPGSASGEVLLLEAPISFWGGVDPDEGFISDPRHPNYSDSVAGKVLAIPATIGSSSSSAIMLELLRHGVNPTALVLSNVDAILVLGIIVARELGYETVPVVKVPESQLETIPRGVRVSVTEDGKIRWRD